MAVYTWYTDRERTQPRHWDTYIHPFGISVPRWIHNQRTLMGCLRGVGLVRARPHRTDPAYGI